MTIAKWKKTAWVLLLSLVLLAAAACSGNQKTRIMPIQSRDNLALSARGVAKLMVWSGFSGEETMLLGPGLRDALAQYGGAQVMVDKKTEALFNVLGSHVYVSSMRRGSFVYSLNDIESPIADMSAQSKP